MRNTLSRTDYRSLQKNRQITVIDTNWNRATGIVIDTDHYGRPIAIKNGTLIYRRLRYGLWVCLDECINLYMTSDKALCVQNRWGTEKMNSKRKKVLQ